MRFSPHFQLFYFDDRLEFCEFFEWKIKMINNPDLFSQPLLLMFTKGANISGGHCIYIYIYTAGKISIEHVTIFLRKYISKGAVDIKFSPDVGNNPSLIHTYK